MQVEELKSSNNRKIAILLPELLGAGAERVMLNLADGIAQKGYPVDLVIAVAKGSYLSEISASVRLIDLQSTGVLRSLPQLIKYLQQNQPAVILSSLHANVVVVWAKYLLSNPCRIILCQHDMFTLTPPKNAKLKVRILPILAKIFYPKADGIVAVSKGVADGLSKLLSIPQEKIRVIYNPVITHDVRKKSKEVINHPWFNPGQPPVVLGVGSLCKRKDFSTLIRAFAEVRKEMAIRLLILGEGIERPNLEALARSLNVEDDISLPGFVLNPYSFMTHSSVFVLSSVAEGLPTVLVEAMYCGSRVISTDCPSGPREILANGKYGQLVPIKDVPTMKEAIKKALAHKTPTPPRESWLPYEQELTTNLYLKYLLDS
jgi:glycosyltransferase involved in cell wall biosynthesis